MDFKRMGLAIIVIMLIIGGLGFGVSKAFDKLIYNDVRSYNESLIEVVEETENKNETPNVKYFTDKESNGSKTVKHVDKGEDLKGIQEILVEVEKKNPDLNEHVFKLDGGQVTDGTLVGKTDDEIREELEKFNRENAEIYKLNAHVQSIDGEVNWSFQNDSTNKSGMRMLVYHNNRIIYTSPLLRPNQFIEKDMLDIMLPEGIYDLNVMIERFDLNSRNLLGVQSFSISMTVY